ncbi:MAG: hypothetical protein ICV63_11160, partial [Coleofasciculus sp. Co-bin14]|nr:hypothetical protein [Coleofasciculus sp. Co-bin14]
TCNPLDLIRDAEDAIAAGQLAQVINKNFSRGGDKGDKFFEEAGDCLVEGILLATKAVGVLEPGFLTSSFKSTESTLVRPGFFSM